MDQLWDRFTQAQPEPSAPLVVVTGLLALAVILPRGSWLIARHVVTIAHEGGHALMALLTGRRLRGIRLHSDTSGLTLSAGRPRGLGMVLTGAAGYVTPSLLGLGAAALLVTGRITVMLWLGVALLAAMLIFIRNVYGALTVLVTGGVLLAISWYAPVEAQAAFAYTLTWFLLLAGPRPVVELQRKRRRGAARDSDADQLARITPLAGIVWVGIFLLVTLLCLAVGALWLLSPVLPAEL